MAKLPNEVAKGSRPIDERRLQTRLTPVPVGQKAGDERVKELKKQLFRTHAAIRNFGSITNPKTNDKTDQNGDPILYNEVNVSNFPD